MIKTRLFFILIKHGINPFAKTFKVKHKLNRLTNKEKEWVEENFGLTLRYIMNEEQKNKLKGE